MSNGKDKIPDLGVPTKERLAGLTREEQDRLVLDWMRRTNPGMQVGIKVVSTPPIVAPSLGQIMLKRVLGWFDYRWASKSREHNKDTLAAYFKDQSRT